MTTWLTTQAHKQNNVSYQHLKKKKKKQKKKKNKQKKKKKKKKKKTKCQVPHQVEKNKCSTCSNII